MEEQNVTGPRTPPRGGISVEEATPESGLEGQGGPAGSLLSAREDLVSCSRGGNPHKPTARQMSGAPWAGRSATLNVTERSDGAKLAAAGRWLEGATPRHTVACL